MAYPEIGTGLSINFGTSGFDANITSVSADGLTRESIDTTHLGTTTARTFMPSDLIDAGTLTLEIQFDPTDSVPVKQAAETITITFPDGTTWAFSGFATSYSWTSGTEELQTGSLQIKISGDVTIT